MGRRLAEAEREAFRREEGDIERGLEERAVRLKEELQGRLGRLEALLAQGKNGRQRGF